MNAIRVGVPHFISIRPLIYGIMRNINPDLRLVYAEPASLAGDIDAGRLDAALIPSIEYLRGSGRHMVEGVSLVARPGTGSLSLVSRVPVADIRRVAVGEFCRSPLTVLRVVLAEQHGVLPDLLVEKNLTNACFDRYDAVLLSGDGALQQELDGCPDGCEVYNLTDMWQEVATAPLVVGVWVYEDATIGTALTRTLVTSRNLGVQNLARLCEGIADTSQYDAGVLYDYLTSCWSYDFGPDEHKGLRVLEDYAMHYDLMRKRRFEKVSSA